MPGWGATLLRRGAGHRIPIRGGGTTSFLGWSREKEMAGGRAKFGLTIPNRGVVIGVTTVAEMLQLAADAESAGWDSVWVGDSIFAKPRLDAMVLLGAIAARTTRVRIGPACFASTPLRNALVLAYQWASLGYLF